MERKHAIEEWDNPAMEEHKRREAHQRVVYANSAAAKAEHDAFVSSEPDGEIVFVPTKDRPSKTPAFVFEE